MLKSQKKLGEILIDKGLITELQLESALREQARTKAFLGEILVKNRQIREGDLLATLSEQFNIPVVNLKQRYIDWNFVKGFSASLILDHRCFPVSQDEWSVTVAIINPLDVWAIKKAEQEAGGLRLKLALASLGDMEDCIQRYHQYLQRNIQDLL